MTNSSTVVASLPKVEPRTLRSGSTPNHKKEEPSLVKAETNHDDTFTATGEDAALAQAEEKLMLEDDEEIASHDEEGNPIVDTEHLENRMLTVAIVNSVVESSGGGGESPNSHRYGLRKRRRLSEKAEEAAAEPGGRVTRSNSSGTSRDPSGGSAETIRTTRSNSKETAKAVEASQSTSSSSAAPSLETEASVSHSVADNETKVVEVPVSDKQLSCTGVPNPLANSTPPGKEQAIPVGANAAKEPVDFHLDHSVPSSSNPLQTVPAALPAAPDGVACPLPTVASQATSQPRPQISESAAPAVVAADVRARRGRIFSIDIDPAGLDFPDLGIVGAIHQQSELSKTAPLPPISATVSGGAPPPAPASAAGTHDKAVGPADTQQVKVQHPADSANNSDLIIVGRDRAMSFEFFSFGLNHDEPLPPAPDQTASSAPTGRPRGDSIIFDPCSFRDGGVLEENALLKSRGNSIDITINEEVAIMNEPGFVPAPTLPSSSEVGAPPVGVAAIGNSTSAPYPIPQRKISHAGPVSAPSLVKSSSSAQMATLPSSLSGSNMAHHSTFQMELLNKDGRIGIYLPEARKERIAKFHSKRKMRIWRKRIKYDCRKKLADSRPRIKGRFVKRSDMDEED